MPTDRFKKGDTVVFDFSKAEIVGVIEEDRGEIGVGGRRLYRVIF